MVTANPETVREGDQPAPSVVPAASVPVGQTPPSTPEGQATPPAVTTPGAPAAPSIPSAPQRPYDLPSEFKEPQTPTIQQGPITDVERQQLEYYRSREQQNSLREQERTLEDYEQQATRFYIQEGHDEQTARLVAQAHRTERQASLQRELELRGTLQARQRAAQDAVDVARQFNVNPRVLGGFTRREDMMRHAAVVKLFGEYRLTTEQRLAALEKGRVPEQQFAGGGAGVSGPGISSYVQSLKDGKAPPTAAEIDRITAGYSTR